MKLELTIPMEINEVYKRIRNYLVGRVIGITRDKSLLEEVVKCLFCYIKIQEIDIKLLNDEKLSKLYRETFKHLKKTLPTVFSVDEEILLDPISIKYVHTELSKIDFNNSEIDPLGSLYQAFIGSNLRMAEGQFFTPSQAIAWIVEAIKPKEGEKIIDPACGPGGFLSYTARYLLNRKVSKELIDSSIFGIEKDEYLANLAKAHISLTTLQEGNIYCGDSIERKDKNGKPLNLDFENYYDVVIANPPFGAKIKTGTDETRKLFDLAYIWKFNKKNNKYFKTNSLRKNTAPQILFLELCIKLLKKGGRMGIVLPESLLSSSTSSYVVQYLLENINVTAVIGMPESLFKTSGKGGTHTKTCLLLGIKKEVISSNKIFMAEAKWCGHDSRGNSIPHNDLPIILENYIYPSKLKNSQLGYFVSQLDIKNSILVPRYYNPEPTNILMKLKKTHDIVSIKTLIDQKIIEIKTGDEIGKLSYGTGTIPFVRTSDLSNWEIKLDPKQGVSESIYNNYSQKQDVQEGDILMVKDGTYLIGSCAYISKYDKKIIYQSHLYKIRVLKTDYISPFLLLALLSSAPVVEQIQSKRFTQDIIDSLGPRINELLLPIPKSEKQREKVSKMLEKSINDRIQARELARKAKLYIVSPVE